MKVLRPQQHLFGTHAITWQRIIQLNMQSDSRCYEWGRTSSEGFQVRGPVPYKSSGHCNKFQVPSCAHLRFRSNF